MNRLIALLVGCAALSLAGCGEGGAADGGADPASLIPANANIYVEGVVRPEGKLRESFLAAAGKILDTPQPETELRALFTQAVDGEVDWARDIEPWLGERAGVWLSRLDGDTPAWGVAIATTDADRALGEALQKAPGPTRDKTHRDVDYKLDADGDAIATVDDFLVIASEAEFKRMVDAHHGQSLAEADRFRKPIGKLSDERIGHFYVDVGALFGAIIGAAGQAAPEAAALGGLLNPKHAQPIVGALLVDGERVAIDTVGSTKGIPLATRLGTGTTDLVGELPAGAWVAAGAPKLGETLKVTFQQTAGLLGAGLTAQLEQQTGLNLEEDVFGWMGDVAFYASGIGPQGIGGAAVIEVTDRDRAAKAFGKISGLITREASGEAKVSPIRVAGAESAFAIAQAEIPKPIVFARSDERVVIAFGEESAREALSPSAKLSGTPLWAQAEQTLGSELEPGFVVGVPQVLQSIEAFAGGGPEYEQVKRYVDAFSVMTVGAEGDGDDQRGRFALGLR